MDISKLLEKAAEAAERRNYKYAIELYLQALVLSPDDAQARRALRAVEHRLTKENPPGFMEKMKLVAIVGKAQSMLIVKKYDGAMQAAEDALKIDPGRAGALMVLARAAAAANHLNAAAVTYEDLRASKGGGAPKVLVEASREYARVLERQQKIKEALEIWGDVQKLTQNQDREAGEKIRNLNAMAMAQTIEQKSATATADGGSIAQSLVKDRKEMEKLQVEAGSDRTSDDIRARIEILKDDIKKHPEDARLYGELGDNWLKLNAYTEARDAYRQAKEHDATNPNWDFKNDDVEIKRMKTELDPLLAKFRQGQANLRDTVREKRLKFLAFRRTSFLAREKQYSTDSRIKHELGLVFYELADLNRDVSLYDQAIMRFQSTYRDPKYRHEAGRYMGLAFARKGQFDLALKRFDETLATLPTEIKDERWKSLLYAKGDTLEKAGRHKDAHDTFVQIYEVDVAYRDVTKRVDELRKQVSA